MSQQSCISIHNLSFHYDAEPIFDEVSLQIYMRDHICLIGRNGAGKSTLLKILSKQIEPDKGDVNISSGAYVAYLSQKLPVFGDVTVAEYLEREHGIFEAHKFAQWQDHFSLQPDQACQTLSGGERKKLQILSMFLKEPDVLLLDEPTNHLDLDAILALEKLLSSFKGTFILISHDRRFLERTTNKVFWLADQQIISFDKGFNAFEKWQEQIVREQENAHNKMVQKLKAETKWMLRGVTARRKRNQRRLKEWQQRRQDVQQWAQKHKDITIDFTGFQKQKTSSAIIFDIVNIKKSFGVRTLFSDFTLRISRGSHIALIGPNGSGKTSFIRVIMGEISPDEGEVRSADELQINYIDQHLGDMDDKMTLCTYLCGENSQQIYVQDAYKHVSGYLEQFLFDPQDMHSPIMRLSGGERRRLKIAKALAKPSDVLILDEPTNDLDMETLDVLKDILSAYKGTIFLVSHDRDFIEAVTTSTLIFDHQTKKITHYVGGLDETLCSPKPQKVSKKKSTSHKSKVEKTNNTSAHKNDSKLTFKEKRLLEILPDEIQDIEDRLKVLEVKLHDQELAINHPEDFQRVTYEFQSLQAEKEEKEEVWLTILSKTL